MTAPATTPEDSRQDRSDESAPPAPTATTPDTPNEPSEPPAGTENDAPSREAAKYRRRLRETEAERDALAAQIDAMRRAEVERLAALPNPALLWDAGTDLAELMDDEGQVDPDKVDAAARRLADTYGVDRGRMVNGVWERLGAPRSARSGRNSRPPAPPKADPMVRTIRGE